MRKLYPCISLDPGVLLGLEEFWSLVGSNQSFLQRALIRAHSEWLDHCYLGAACSSAGSVLIWLS
jgi:hypothetical protein